MPYRVGFYDADGQLIKHQEAWPAEDNHTALMVAHFSAGVARNRGAATVLVWEDVTTIPAQQIEDAPAAQARWSWGPDAPPVPEYRIEVDRKAQKIYAFTVDDVVSEFG